LPDAKAADKGPDTPASKDSDAKKPLTGNDDGSGAAPAPKAAGTPEDAGDGPKPASSSSGADAASAPNKDQKSVQSISKATTAAESSSTPAQKAKKLAESDAGKDDKAAKDVQDDGADKARQAIEKAEAAIREAERAEQEAQFAVERAAAAKAAAEAAAEAEYKAIAEQAKADTANKSQHTFKRESEEIFRRDMDEPEFFLDKKDRFPRPILTAQQQESLTRQAEIPQDQTPEYVPQHVLSPEFEGLSNYERGVSSYLAEMRDALKRLKQDPEANPDEISAAKSNIRYLESLHENFYIGMNVFRTAKGGRSKAGA